MKIILAVLSMAAFLLQVGSLTCYECTSTSASCSPVIKTCGPAEDVCIMMSQRSISIGPARAELLTKGCSNHVSCTGNMSFTLANVSYSAITKCCNTSLCNNETVSVPDSAAPNGLVCTSCYSDAKNGCDGDDKPTINCTGTDNCIDITVTLSSLASYSLKGCGTLPTCNDTFGFQFFTGQVRCCNTSHCNNVTIPVKSTPTYNNHKCYDCVTFDNTPCNPSQTTCYGSLTKCGDVSATLSLGSGMSNIFVKGCISPPLCQLQSAFAVLGMGNTTKIDCCDGDQCNNRGVNFATRPPATTTNAGCTTTVRQSASVLLALLLMGLFT